jgi:hypothetical protein
MSFVQLVASEGKPCDGPLRLCSLPARQDLPILSTPTHMPETSTSQPGHHESTRGVAETVVVLTIKHKGKLPADLLEKLTKRAYDCAAIHGVQPEVSAKEWYALEVKEQA